MIIQLLWVLLLFVAAVSCAYGTRRDSFFWAMGAGLSAIVLGLHGYSQAGDLLDKLSGHTRPLTVSAFALLALAYWAIRFGKWVKNG